MKEFLRLQGQPEAARGQTDRAKFRPSARPSVGKSILLMALGNGSCICREGRKAREKEKSTRRGSFVKEMGLGLAAGGAGRQLKPAGERERERERKREGRKRPEAERPESILSHFGAGRPVGKLSRTTYCPWGHQRCNELNLTPSSLLRWHPRERIKVEFR